MFISSQEKRRFTSFPSQIFAFFQQVRIIIIHGRFPVFLHGLSALVPNMHTLTRSQDTMHRLSTPHLFVERPPLRSTTDRGIPTL